MGAPARAARRRADRDAAKNGGPKGRKPSAADTPPEPPEADTPAGGGDGDGEVTANMVLVGVQRVPNSRDLAVGPIVPQGDVGAAEVLHILEKAVKVWRKSAGL